MKPACLTVLLLIAFIIASAQSMQERVKQLQQQIAEHTQQDTFRVNRINELVDTKNIPLGQRDTLTNEALAIARKIAYPVGEGYALINLANVRFRQQDTATAYGLFRQAMAVAEKTGNQQLIGYVWYNLGATYSTADPQRYLSYSLKAIDIAQKINDKKLLVLCQISVTSFYQNTDYIKSLDWALKALKNAEENNFPDEVLKSYFQISGVYTAVGDLPHAMAYTQKALVLSRQVGNIPREVSLLNTVGENYRLTGEYNKAIESYRQALQIVMNPQMTGLLQSNLADVYVRKSDLPNAFANAFSALAVSKKFADEQGEAWVDGILGRAHLATGKTDSAIYYGSQGLAVATENHTLEFMRDNAEVLANAYAKQKDFAKAYQYQQMYYSYRDSMTSSQVSNKANLMEYNYNLDKKQAQIAALTQEKKTQQYFLLSALVVLALIAVTVIILLRSNRQKQKANALLSRQKQLIEEQRDKTNKALDELQVTQKQLIQSEKMASLGELTAGIAHEIQNPLNFVNNFSEVNNELIDEMNAETDVEEIKAIAADIKQNNEKIAFHGKRADSIVKGMMQHSRQTKGVKEPTDLNALCDEYMRLSYHGLRAKDKSFNAHLETDFDSRIDKVNIIPQDISRVILNILTNAFYAVNEKSATAGKDYRPTVSLQTKKLNQSVEIRISDDGNGIPQSVINKIFQPFFTTKPSGQGTGLGLSMAYDIITKEHGGTIDVDSREGEGTTFTIRLAA